MDTTAATGTPEAAPVRAGRFRLEFDGPGSWSDRAAAVYGYRPCEVQPSTALLSSHEHPADRGAVAGLLERIRRGAPVAAGSHRVIDRAGGSRWVGVGAEPIRRGEHVIGAHGVILDLQQALHAAEKPVVDARLARFLSEHREREQAVGMLMLLHGVPAERAREVLDWRATETGQPVTVLARALLAAARHLPPSTTLRNRVDHLLLTPPPRPSHTTATSTPSHRSDDDPVVPPPT
ncbi:PAS domain-containing protein [Nocardia sp. NPDC050697]|uniref:ANTAR domain-containing protein n=1 Tax=Nocardia sp. NPDC050697 TaxID=3155158 RepID=UPI0034023965